MEVDSILSVLAGARGRALEREEAVAHTEAIAGALGPLLSLERFADVPRWGEASQCGIALPPEQERPATFCVILFVPPHLAGKVRIGEPVRIPDDQLDDHLRLGFVRRATEREIRERRTFTDPLRRRLAFLRLTPPPPPRAEVAPAVIHAACAR